MDADTAIRTLATRGYVVDIGQIDAAARKALSKEVRAGRVERVRAPYAGLMLAKTHYVSDRIRFDRAQAASAASLRLAIAMDESARSGRERRQVEA